MDTLAESNTPTHASLCTQANTIHIFKTNKFTLNLQHHITVTHSLYLLRLVEHRKAAFTHDGKTQQRRMLLAYVWTFIHKEPPKHIIIPSLFFITPPVLTPTTSTFFFRCLRQILSHRLHTEALFCETIFLSNLHNAPALFPTESLLMLAALRTLNCSEDK